MKIDPTPTQKKEVATAYALMTDTERDRIGTAAWRNELAARLRQQERQIEFFAIARAFETIDQRTRPSRYAS